MINKKEIQYQSRLPSMDGLRFIMCLGIACLHFSIYFFSYGGNESNFIGRLDYFNDVFFMISGFFLMRSTIYNPSRVANYRQYLFLRFARIYPLYFVTLLYFIAVSIFANYGYLQPHNPDRYDLGLLWPHILLIQSWGGFESLIFNYPTWALSALWLMYMVFPIIYLLAKKSKTALGLLIVFSFVVGEFVARNYCGEVSELTRIQRCNLGILRCFPVFLMGVFLANLRPLNINKLINYTGIVAMIIILFFTPLFWHGAPRIIFITCLIISILNADYNGYKFPLSWSKFKHLSQYSYAIFLVHPIIASVYISYLLPKLFDLDSLYTSEYSILYRFLFLVSALTLSFFTAILSFHIIEKPAYLYALRFCKINKMTLNPIWKIK